MGIPSSWDYTADVVVIGNGGAGTAAAIGAYDGGASVLILEKAPKGLDGGNTGVAGGTCTMVSPLTDWITIVNMACFGTTPLDVVTAFCTEANKLPNWIASLGGSMKIGSLHTWGTLLLSSNPMSLRTTNVRLPISPSRHSHTLSKGPVRLGQVAVERTSSHSLTTAESPGTYQSCIRRLRNN